MNNSLGVALTVTLFYIQVARAADTPPPQIPLVRGLTMVSAFRSPKGDRENVVTVDDASDAGVNYAWRVSQKNAAGQKSELTFTRFVRTADLAQAKRIHTVFRSEDKTAYPGYTAFTLSTGIYDALRASGSIPFMVTSLDGGAFGESFGVLGAVLSTTLKLKGTLTVVSQGPVPFPLLVNGQRVSVPTMQLRGQFAFQEEPLQQDFWVLANREHPLILKVVTGKDVLQMVRIELPGGASALQKVEQTLNTACRAELPGIYFEFGTADLNETSSQTLAGIGSILSRHPEWTLAVEGHTDSIGTDAANLTLSKARAEAVRVDLVSRRGVNAHRLSSAGFGASRPREPNATIEGRARNRRVELVRPCAGEKK